MTCALSLVVKKMSSPVVERIRTIPLIVEKEMPMEAEEIVS